jgi:hypothetical protein
VSARDKRAAPAGGTGVEISSSPKHPSEHR